VPASAALCYGVYSLVEKKNNGRALYFSGFWLTLAATLDLSLAIYLVLLFLYLCIFQRTHLYYFLLGTLIPGGLAILLNYNLVGTPFPPQMFSEGYDFSGSPFAATVAGNQTADNIFAYTFALLFGERGVFAFSPVTAVFVFGFWKMITARQDKTPYKIGWTVAMATLLYLCYFIFLTDNFGGEAFGVRWLLNPIPLLALLATYAPLVEQHQTKIAASRFWVVLLILAIPSIGSSCYGALAPWSIHTPLVRAVVAPPQERAPVSLVTSGYGRMDELDPALLATFGSNLVHWRQIDTTQAFVIPQGESWWALRQPTNDRLAQLLGVASHPATIKGDLTAVVARVTRDDLLHTAYQEVDLPLPPFPQQKLPLPATFAHKANEVILFHGFDIVQTNQELSVVTVWQLETTPIAQTDRRIFIHLLDENGKIMVQSDLWGGRYDTLQDGDYVFQEQTLPLSHLSPATTYWLQLGIYDPHTGQRLHIGGQDRVLLQTIEMSE